MGVVPAARLSPGVGWHAEQLQLWGSLMLTKIGKLKLRRMHAKRCSVTALTPRCRAADVCKIFATVQQVPQRTAGASPPSVVAADVTAKRRRR